MAITSIAADALWSGGCLHCNVEIVLENGCVRTVRPRGHSISDRTVPLVSVPFTDLQVNGGGGVMVNSDPTPEGLRRIAQAHKMLGTGDILPTVITDRPEVMEAAAAAALVCAGKSGIIGIHIEGPHLCPARRGTHEAALLRPLDQRTVTLVQQLRKADLPVMITLAPELAPPALLNALVSSGAVVCAGHSSASAEEARHAFASGVRGVTHLFNAMEQMTSRAPGLLGTAINSNVHCGIICDGIHVSWDMLRVAVSARPKRNLMFIVSDAMSTVGGPDHFELYGRGINVTARLLPRAVFLDASDDVGVDDEVLEKATPCIG